MSVQEKYELIGKVMQEHRSKSGQLEMLKIKANKTGQSMRRMADMLSKQPAQVTIDGESYDAQFSRFRSFQKSEIVDFPTVQALVKEIQTLTLEVQELERQKKSLGF